MTDEERRLAGEKMFAVPVIGTIVKQASARKVQRLLGLWVMWHTCGGFNGLTEQNLFPRATLYQNLGEFQQLFGVHVEDWMPDAVAALKAGSEQPDV